jgi:outer membrane protein OmpA-like peptidoglycan-associated protein
MASSGAFFFARHERCAQVAVLTDKVSPQKEPSMTRHHHHPRAHLTIVTTARAVLAAVAMAAMNLANVANAAHAAPPANDSAAQSAPLFIEPPAPEELARLLFKPRYRSVGGVNQREPNLFSMMINFEFDSTRILPQSLPLLDSVGQMLDLPETRAESLVVEGHTDASGAEGYNQSLSERRATAIRDYLVASFGVKAERLIIVGYGKTRPYDGSEPTNPLNRRAAFRPLKAIQ